MLLNVKRRNFFTVYNYSTMLYAALASKRLVVWQKTLHH